MKPNNFRTQSQLLGFLIAAFGAFGLLACASTSDTEATEGALAAPTENDTSSTQEHLSLQPCNEARESVTRSSGEPVPSFGCDAGFTCVMFSYGFEPQSEWGGKCLESDDIDNAVQRLAAEAGCDMPWSPDVGWYPRLVHCNTSD